MVSSSGSTEPGDEDIGGKQWLVWRPTGNSLIAGDQELRHTSRGRAEYVESRGDQPLPIVGHDAIAYAKRAVEPWSSMMPRSPLLQPQAGRSLPRCGSATAWHRNQRNSISEEQPLVAGLYRRLLMQPLETAFSTWGNRRLAMTMTSGMIETHSRIHGNRGD